ncbi:collagen-like triple helix repeat-containing protein [Flagellimonas zhangzhouensis]|uniref:Collagen triple helix repeat-containing protein n=1 Tax=Flagellimonas zhangzhouensis TaxID=1073328 RepID=A0A1H2X2K1_9FLAO|nr:collagen-like protein [Allomuricauda zhangzhouensis]SDQ27373.1 hypothetical protein SAMN05216294_1179 [Allomuricauda zhangzhouensis]SDW87055.1 hypothetical protein SAMN04487892_2559 [Allomuricauda zhangzhouensis]
MKKATILCISLLALSIGFVSCSDGADGLPGTNGNPGETGQPGSKGNPGTDGTNGEDALGYEELTKYGSVTVNLEGTRPDDVPFENTTEFKFSNTELTDGIYIENNITLLYNARFLSIPDDTYQNVYQEAFLAVENLGGEIEALDNFYYMITNLPIIGEDHKYFVLNLTFGQNDPSDIIQDFVFDPSDNHLTYTYSFAVNAANNSSNHDLNVSGEVDVYLLDELLEN